MKQPIIYWFRQDLRIDDLPGLAAAAATGQPLLACFVLDDVAPGEHAPGGASRWWLQHSLAALALALEALGGRLVLRRGPARAMLVALARETEAAAVYCSRQYEPWAVADEQALHDALEGDGIDFRRYPGTLLFEPEQVATRGGTPFRVFTPFWRECLAATPPAAPAPPPARIHWHSGPVTGDRLEDWRLYPARPDWARGWESFWQPGSAGAGHRLQTFLAGGIGDYSEGRDHPERQATSRLSPHLHFGEISPRSVWHAARAHVAREPGAAGQVDKFLSELGWREFSYHLLLHFPHIAEQPFRESFTHFPWLGERDHLRAWQRGLTGYPVVDAGMRELWQTGYMHNRIRMVVASFLTKHLLIHWRKGADWFRDTLVDADLANNSCGWQWVAGSGADAAPYFRIFNPVTQGQKFDSDGGYVRRWVPELAALPDTWIHRPWEAPAEVLAAAGVVLGTTYPQPIVDHPSARAAALAAYEIVRSA